MKNNNKKYRDFDGLYLQLLLKKCMNCILT